MTRRSALVIALAMAAAAGAALAVKETDCLAAVGNQSKGAEAIAAAGPTDKAELPKLAAQTSTSGSLDAGAILSADRATTWNPGVRGAGGIPTRTTVCSTLNPRGGTSDDTAQIQAAINACPAGQVVQLAAGTFLVNSGNYLLINKGITLRGAGPGETTLAKTNGAKPFQEAVGAKPSPLIVVGPHLFSSSPDPSDIAASTGLTADAVKGEYAVTVANATGFAPGQIVLLDEASAAGWQPDPQGRGKIWASPDWRVVWQKHDPAIQYVDDFAPDAFPTTPNTAGSWFSRYGPPHCRGQADRLRRRLDHHLHHAYSHFLSRQPAAQLSRYRRPHVMNAGVEDLKLVGGDAGNLRFQWAALSWARNVDNTAWHGEGFAIDRSFRIELREFYVHDAAWAQRRRRGIRHQPLGRLSRGTDREWHRGQSQQGHGGALRRSRLRGRLQLRGHGLHQHHWRLDRARAQRQPYGGLAPRPLRGQLRPERRQRQHPRQQHLPHLLPQSSAWHSCPIRQSGRRQDQ